MSDKAALIACQYFWQPMSTCPRGIKVQALNEGGVPVYAIYNGTDTSWRGWAPVPSKPPADLDWNTSKDVHYR